MGQRLIDFRNQDYDPERMRRLVQQLEFRFTNLERPTGTGYSLAGTLDKSLRQLDVDSASLDDVRNVLGNLIQDLLDTNRLRGDA